MRIKPHFKSDIQKGELGSAGLADVLRVAMPKVWFSGHFHVRFISQLHVPDESSVAGTTKV